MSGTTWQPADAEITVLTFKEGLLSRVAHDLELRAGEVDAEVDPDTPAIRLRVAARSLAVKHACKKGAAAPGALSPKDCRDIEDNLRKDVLAVARHPEIRFESGRMEGTHVEGVLTLEGRERTISSTWREEGGWRLAEVELDQRDFGIKPFKAMMGAIKIQPRVRVKIRVRWP